MKILRKAIKKDRIRYENIRKSLNESGIIETIMMQQL